MGRRFYLGLGLLLLLLIGGLLLSAWVSRKISPLEQALTEAAGGGSDRGFFPGGAAVGGGPGRVGGLFPVLRASDPPRPFSGRQHPVCLSGPLAAGRGGGGICGVLLELAGLLRQIGQVHQLRLETVLSGFRLQNRNFMIYWMQLSLRRRFSWRRTTTVCKRNRHRPGFSPMTRTG